MMVRSAYRVEVQPLRVIEPPAPQPEPEVRNAPTFKTPPLTHTSSGPTIAHIKGYTEGFFRVPSGAISKRNRKREVARPRQVAMYLAKTMTDKTYPAIGQLFGGYDHTTVLHAVRQVERLMAEDERFADEVDTLKRRVVGE